MLDKLKPYPLDFIQKAERIKQMFFDRGFNM